MGNGSDIRDQEKTHSGFRIQCQKKAPDPQHWLKLILSPVSGSEKTPEATDSSSSSCVSVEGASSGADSLLSQAALLNPNRNRRNRKFLNSGTGTLTF
jgi:hypothetical protein